MTFFYGFIRTERLADAVLSSVIIVICLLGGSMVPMEQMGETMLRIGRFSPVYWAVDGMKRIILEDAGFEAITGYLALLYGLSFVTIVAGVVMLRIQVRRGG